MPKVRKLPLQKISHHLLGGLHVWVGKAKHFWPPSATSDYLEPRHSIAGGIGAGSSASASAQATVFEAEVGQVGRLRRRFP